MEICLYCQNTYSNSFLLFLHCYYNYNFIWNDKVLAEQLVWLFSSGPTGEGDPVELMKGWHFPSVLQPIADRIQPRDIAFFQGCFEALQGNVRPGSIMINLAVIILQNVHKLRLGKNMQQEIKSINLPFLFKLGSVNCYIVKTATGFVLIDTGWASRRSDLEKELESAGCRSGNVELIVLTHGDFDHTGNCAYLSKKFGTKTAMHVDDSGMVEHVDMFWNRKSGNILTRIIAKFFFRLRKSDRFRPDLYFEDGYDLSGYGFDARVLHIPGHSKDSLGILTTNGELFCSDLFENTKKPVLNSIIDDLVTANASVEKLKCLAIKTVYPGHGKPFR